MAFNVTSVAVVAEHLLFNNIFQWEMIGMANAKWRTLVAAIESKNLMNKRKKKKRNQATWRNASREKDEDGDDKDDDDNNKMIFFCINLNVFAKPR